MVKIKDILIDNNDVSMETNDGYIVNVPIKDSYSLNLFSKAYSDTKYDLKNIKYYNKCADISLFPIWISLGLLIAGYITKFPVMDMILIDCGGMSSLSLLSFATFKLATKVLKNKVCNNSYWCELYNYSLDGNKINTKSNSKCKSVKNNKSNEYSMKRDKIIQDVPIKRTDSTYHLNSNEIIQDEFVYYKRGSKMY